MSEDVKEYEKCPICFGENGGMGQRYSSYPKGQTLIRKYYKCDKCGHTWSQDFKREQPIIQTQKPVVQTQQINLETRLPQRQNRSKNRRANK